jgi:3-dehydroquinate dehydratase II
MQDKPHIAIINGPNLNLLGIRQPDIYGFERFDDYFEKLVRMFPLVHFTYYHSNTEGELIDELHRCGFEAFGIVFNGGGYTHTSIAIADAIAAITAPVVEVHITNIYAREEFRNKSLTAKHCRGVITGLGLRGYELAVHALLP